MEVGEVLGVGDVIVPDNDNYSPALSGTLEFGCGPAASSGDIAIASSGELAVVKDNHPFGSGARKRCRTSRLP